MMLSRVRLGLSGLERAYLTVPSETLETFRFELVVEIFGRAYFGARHGGD